MKCACSLPHGSPPSTLQRIQYSCGVEFFDHPITPFEQVLWRAAVQGADSFQGVVRGLLQMHSSTGMEACPVLIDLLHWYLERSGYPSRSYMSVRAIVQPNVDRMHEAVERHALMVQADEYGYFKTGIETETMEPCRTPGCKGSVVSSSHGTTDGLCHGCWVRSQVRR